MFIHYLRIKKSNISPRMKNFLEEDFLLTNSISQKLYFDFAKDLPLIDYHSHLSPSEIASNKSFENLTEIWLKGDHYKWRAMRAAGVHESYISGNQSDENKFKQWANTLPYALRNPLYHWSHLELRRYFGIEEILSPKTAESIYQKGNELLKTDEFRVQGLIQKMKVEFIGTTDDPLDDLESHQVLQESKFPVQVSPSFRPDKSMNTENPDELMNYILRLETLVGDEIWDFESYLLALKSRHDYFGKMGCRISDHGLDQPYADDYSLRDLDSVFKKIRKGEKINREESNQFKSALLYNFSIWNHEKGWVQQYHIGALRNNNSRGFKSLGPDSGFDSMGDLNLGKSLSKFLDRLDQNNQLAKTILYNLNPRDNALFATMAGNFNDGSIAGKIQWGSAWWFLDQKEGMKDQLNTLSSMGLISKMVGMLTDSRSFLSFPRHEYFRRILCNLLGEDIENGELPHDLNWTGKIIQDIAYYNAKAYFSI